MDKNGKSSGFFSNKKWHFLFLGLFLLILGLIFWRIFHYGVRVNPDNYQGKENDPDVMDIMNPVTLTEEQKAKDDGITTIVALGNAPFADDRGSDDNLANIIAKEPNTVVYNCSFSESYLASEGDSILSSPEDMSSLYWLTCRFCFPEEKDLQLAYENVIGKSSPENQEAYNTLSSIDFSTVDVIAILYDASDYFKGNPVSNPENFTDIHTFSGCLAASLELIQRTYPYIRIILLSPAYAYAVNESGDYINSEIYRYGKDPLSSYVSAEGALANIYGITFLDNLYGTIHEDNASDYLTDNLRLNIEGRKLVAERFLYALYYFH